MELFWKDETKRNDQYNAIIVKNNITYLECLSNNQQQLQNLAQVITSREGKTIHSNSHSCMARLNMISIHSQQNCEALKNQFLRRTYKHRPTNNYTSPDTSNSIALHQLNYVFAAGTNRALYDGPATDGRRPIALYMPAASGHPLTEPNS